MKKFWQRLYLQKNQEDKKELLISHFLCDHYFNLMLFQHGITFKLLIFF